MPEVDEYRTKIEAIKQRLDGSNGEGNEEIRELKERLGTVRDNLRRKQETIDSQAAEIETLREENGQLSEMLGQAVAALEAQSQGGIKEIVQSIDTEFADLLAEGDTAATPSGQAEGPAEEQGGGRREPTSNEAEPTSNEAEPAADAAESDSSEGATWDPDNEAPPALKRIMGRRRR
jgi:uncharacterized phage infection (PIP) family protein YhgE